MRAGTLTRVATGRMNQRPLDPQDRGSEVIAAQSVFFACAWLFADVLFVQCAAQRVVPKWSPDTSARPVCFVA